MGVPFSRTAAETSRKLGEDEAAYSVRMEVGGKFAVCFLMFLW